MNISPRYLAIIIQLALVATPKVVHAEEPRQAEDAKAIIDKSLKALGGVEKISKLHAVCLKGTCSTKEVKDAIAFDASFAALDKVRIVIDACDLGENKKLILVKNGGKCWAKHGEEESFKLDTETTMLGDDYLHAMCLPDLLMTLKGNGYTLATLEDQKIDGRDAVGLRVTHKNHQEVRLFFDKTSALPIKSEVKFVAKLIDDIQKEVSVELFFSNYKEFAGVSHFTHVRIHLNHDDFEINLKEVELREKLDAAMFAKP
jgi:hypothetical protein